MARARNIKPAFFDNDELAENEPLGRLLFIGLWTLADHKGNLEWRSKRIKKQVLAYDNCDIDKLAINLDKSGFIRFYSDGDNLFVNVLNFNKHQNPHKNEREKGTEIPLYSEEGRQAIDLNTLTINHDLSGLKRNESDSNHADSLFLNPDSLSLIPDSITPESGQARAPAIAVDYSALQMSDNELTELKRIRKKSKGGALTQRVINGLAKEFNTAVDIGYSYDEILTEWETRGWKSFKAEWIKPKQSNNGLSALTQKNIQNTQGDW
jgi:hypothetical protein